MCNLINTYIHTYIHIYIHTYMDQCEWHDFPDRVVAVCTRISSRECVYDK